MPEIELQGTVYRDFGNLFKGLGIGNSVANGVFGLLQSPMNYLFQRAAAREQNKMAIDWWNMQNEYNSPKSQIKRLVEAGLNPNLMYGQMSSSNAGDIGSPRVAQAEFNMSPVTSLVSNLGNVLSLYSSFIDLQDKSLELNRKRADMVVPEGFGNYETWASYQKKLGLRRMLTDLDSSIKHNKSLDLSNEFNMRSMQDRLDLLKNQERSSFYRSLMDQTSNEFLENEKALGIFGQIFRMILSIFK